MICIEGKKQLNVILLYLLSHTSRISSHLIENIRNRGKEHELVELRQPFINYVLHYALK